MLICRYVRFFAIRIYFLERMTKKVNKLFRANDWLKPTSLLFDSGTTHH